jgi:Kef-type K+ transport system membrane component KefB
MTFLELGLKLFLQLTVILACCRAVGWLGRRFLGQTQVVMEMIAGVLLGPSLFGLFWPEAQAWLFPKTLAVTAGGATVEVMHPSMAVLSAMSQIGLVLYMFIVGLEFNAGHLRSKLRGALLISAAGIVVPFILGGALGLQLADRRDLFTDQVTAFSAVLYVGASMSITAFPMLARILFERGIAGTRMGTITLAAGSMDDAVAWCLLAVVLATLKSSPMLAVVTIGGGALYGLVMATGGKRLFAGFQRRFERESGLSVDSFTLVILAVMLCGLATDAIGIHAVFGGFVCGAVMPRGPFAKAVQERAEMIVTTLLLPVFFVFSGLNTRIGLLNSRELLGLTAVVMLLAIAGKGIACMLAARLAGETWRDSAAIGTLMNARGLMELIILNIGLQNGVITPTLFTIFILMAIVTTVMASPLYLWIAGRAPAAVPSGSREVSAHG